MVQSRNESSINIKIKDQNICEEGFDVKPVESNELKFTKSLKTFGNSWLSKSFGLSANAMGTRQQLPELSSSLIWKSSDVFLHYFFKAYFLFFLHFLSYCRQIVVLPYLKEGAFISAPAGTCNCLKMAKNNCRYQILRGDEKVWVCTSEAVCNHHFVQKDQRKKSRISATLFQSPFKIFLAS